MPTYPATVLILKKTKLGESDLILTLLSQDGSQIRAVAKGARKPKSRLCGVVEPYCVVDMLLAKGRNLDIVTEARCTDTHADCRVDLEHTTAAATICELLSKLSLEGQIQRRIFPLSDRALKAVGSSTNERIPLVVAAHMIKTLCLIGYRPELSCCVSCGTEVHSPRSFSWQEGGVLCSSCAATIENNENIETMIPWISFLISSTFDSLETCETDIRTSCAQLHFCEQWLNQHVGIRLKSTDLFYELYS